MKQITEFLNENTSINVIVEGLFGKDHVELSKELFSVFWCCDMELLSDDKNDDDIPDYSKDEVKLWKYMTSHGAKKIRIITSESHKEQYENVENLKTGDDLKELWKKENISAHNYDFKNDKLNSNIIKLLQSTEIIDDKKFYEFTIKKFKGKYTNISNYAMGCDDCIIGFTIQADTEWTDAIKKLDIKDEDKKHYLDLQPMCIIKFK